MQCPYCDSTIKEVPEPPVGKYTYIDGYVEIGTDSVTFYRRPFLFIKERKRTILFSQIVAVSFGNADAASSGFLCVREKKDRHVPLATKAAEAVYDEAAAYFRRENNEQFFTVYRFLRQCADAAEEKTKDTLPEKKVNRNQEMPDLLRYYDMYKPDRVRAIMALRIDTGMDPVSAKNAIDTYFDSRENG